MRTRENLAWQDKQYSSCMFIIIKDMTKEKIEKHYSDVKNVISEALESV